MMLSVISYKEEHLLFNHFRLKCFQVNFLFPVINHIRLFNSFTLTQHDKIKFKMCVLDGF